MIRFCCHLESDNNSKEKITKIIGPDINWAYFLEKARREKVSSLVYNFFSKNGDIKRFVPENVLAELKGIYYSTAGRNLLICRTLEDISDKFKNEGIRFIIFKGLALAEAVYQNVGLRPSGDLDILVKIQDLPKADRILEVLGYKKPFMLKDFSRISFSAYRNSFLYDKPDASPVHIHLFWHIINLYPYAKDIVTKIDMDKIWEAAVGIEIGDRKALTFSLPHQIIYLCLHALTHLYKPFILLCDINEIASLEKERIDWDMLVTEAFNFGLSKYVYYGLYFAAEILGADIPHSILSRLHPKKLSFFEQRFISGVLDDRIMPNERYRLFLLYLSMNDTLVKRLIFVYNICFPPKKELFIIKLKDPACVNTIDYINRILGRG